MVCEPKQRVALGKDVLEHLQPADARLGSRLEAQLIALPSAIMETHGAVLYLVGDESDILLARRRLTTEP